MVLYIRWCYWAIGPDIVGVGVPSAGETLIEPVEINVSTIYFA
jgi:hypothetical protein